MALTEITGKLPIEMNSNMGHIGNFYWMNSSTEPEHDWRTNRWQSRWGGWFFGEPSWERFSRLMSFVYYDVTYY
jgi:hypothetical protein